MKRSVKTALIAVGGAAVLCAAAVGIMCGVYYSAAPGEFSAVSDGTVIYAGEEPLYSIGRLRTGSGFSDEALELICGGRLRMDPVSAILGQRSVSERTVLAVFPDIPLMELIARTKALEDGRTDRELMELYCSTAYFGNGIYGAEDAAAYYFGKKPGSLDKYEAETLADICSNEKYQRMTKAELAREFSGVEFAPQEVLSSSSSAAQVLEELRGILTGLGCSDEEQSGLIYGGGLRVYTTLDSAVQSAVDRVITEQPAMEHFQIAMQVSDYSGGVLASTGGADNGGCADRCVIPRSPGSAIKPLSVYSPAIEQGLITWASFLPDRPDAENWPQNYNGVFEQDVMTAYALRQSKNTCAVYLEKLLGGDVCYEAVKRLGFAYVTPEDKVPIGMGMGYLVNGVTPGEMAAAYQIFGNGGSYTAPHFIDRITSADGTELYQYSAEAEQVISPETAWIMNRMMKSNIEMEDGLGGKAKLDGIEVFGKTGTRDNVYEVVTDNWFVGGTPDMCAAVWTGSDDTELMISGGTFPSAAGIWSMVMSKIPPQERSFTNASEAVSAEICRAAGGIAGEMCPETEIGWFAPGTLPEKCSQHK